MSAEAKTGLTCRQADEIMDEALGRPDAEIPKPLADHLAACERCARLHGWLSNGLAADPPEDLAPRICSRIRQSLRPVKPLPSGRVLLIRFLGLFGLLLAVLMALTGAGAAGSMTLLQILSVSAVLASASVLLLLSVTCQMAPGQHGRFRAEWVICAFAAGFVTVTALLFPWEGVSAAVRQGWACTHHGLLLAVPAGLLLLALAMRGAPLSYARIGSTLGAASGLIGLTVLQFSCKNQNAGHLMIWHGGVVLLCVAAGYAAGKAADYFSGLRLRRQTAAGGDD